MIGSTKKIISVYGRQGVSRVVNGVVNGIWQDNKKICVVKIKSEGAFFAVNNNGKRYMR